jgi:hypothetical protein
MPPMQRAYKPQKKPPPYTKNLAMRHLLLALLLLLSFSGYCQTTEIKISETRARRIVDSLWALPKVRKEAARWQQAAGHFQTARDSAKWALAYTKQELRATDERLVLKDKLIMSKDTEVDWWKKVARRRGFLNYCLAAVSAGLGYLLLK